MSAPGQNGRAGGAASSEPKRLLVVDDEPSIHSLLRSWLYRQQSVGLTVAGTARNGREALAEAMRVHPHVVLLDAIMPVMDGMAVLPVLRELVPGARIIVYSGVEDTKKAALEAGADAWLLKSPDMQVLLQVLAEQAVQAEQSHDERSSAT